MKLVHKGPIKNKSALVKLMAHKQLSETMLTQFIEAYMWHSG